MDIGVSGECVLPRSKASEPSELVSMETDWEGYKKHISSLASKRYLFPGQSSAWRLRTSFHRSGRANVSRFLREDIPALHRHLSATTKHVFNLTIGDENGACCLSQCGESCTSGLEIVYGENSLLLAQNYNLSFTACEFKSIT
jgi:hypothetical protein